MNKIALITGASSGIGRDFARNLASKGYNLIIVSRDEKKLEELKKDLKVEVTVIPMDLSDSENCKQLHEEVKNKFGNIDILINNAGFGEFGFFTETNLDFSNKYKYYGCAHFNKIIFARYAKSK